MKLTNWGYSPVHEALGWTLLHAFWQGFVLVALVAVLLHLCRQRPAAVRYWLGIGGLFMQGMLSVFTFGWYYRLAGLSLAGPAYSPAGGMEVFRVGENPATMSWFTTARLFLSAHLNEIVAVWLIGVAVFGLRLLGGWLQVHRLRTTARASIPTRLAEAAERVAQKLNVSARLRVSARVTSPLVVDVFKPLVLWPVGLLAQLSPAEIEAVLAHELAHVRRHDYLFNVIQSVIEVVYFFHPALWWLSARVREERELCCDSLALSVLNDARGLARALARVAEWQRAVAPKPVLALGLVGNRHLLLLRVQRILGITTQPRATNGTLAGLTLATLLLLSVSVYAVQQGKTQHSSSSKTHRQYELNKKSRYETDAAGRLRVVIWQNRQLPAGQIKRLQDQLDKVKKGQLSLDAVKQPDRDILLAIIEAEATALVTPAEAPHLAAPVVQPKPVRSAEPVVSPAPEPEGMRASALPADSSIRPRIARARQLDSLDRLMSQQEARMEALARQLESERFKVEAVERQREIIAWKRETLMREREKWLDQRRQLLANAKTKQLSEVEKSVAESERQIQQSEQAIDEVEKKLAETLPSLQQLREPLRELEHQLHELSRSAEETSRQMSQESLHGQLAERDAAARNRHRRSERHEFSEGVRPPHPPHPVRPALAPRVRHGAEAVPPPTPPPTPRTGRKTRPALAPTPPPPPPAPAIEKQP